VFDAAHVSDKSTYDNPAQYAEGVRQVLVNGVPVIDAGKPTGKLPGKVLRGAGFAGR